MVKKTVHMRVHPEFFMLAKNSDMSSRDFTKMITNEIWEEKMLKKNKKKRGLEAFNL